MVVMVVIFVHCFENNILLTFSNIQNMRKLAFVLILFVSYSLKAQKDKVLLIGNTYNFEIKDGSNRNGRLDSITSDYYYINNPAIGPDRIRKMGVSKIKQIQLTKDGTFANPHYSRYLFGPSALPQPKGEVYWNNLDFEYNTLQVGVTENLSVGVGGLLLTSLFSGSAVLLPNFKYSFRINDKSHIAIGGLFLLLSGEKNFGSNVSAALPFLVYTYGNSEGNISAGAGWAHAGNSIGWAPKPTGYLAGMKRLARNWVFQGEGYLLNNTTDNSIYIATFRNIKPSSSWDFGVIRLQAGGDVFAFPLIGYTLKF